MLGECQDILFAGWYFESAPTSVSTLCPSWLQRLSLLEVSLEDFTVEEVFDAARGLFEDLSDEQVLEYMVEANTNDEIVHSIQSLG